MERRKPLKLRNSLLELCIVVGVDEDTGLEPSRASIKTSSLTEGNYNPFTIGAVWGEGASFPYAETSIPIDGYSAYDEGSVIIASPIKGSSAPKNVLTKRRRSSLLQGGVSAAKSPNLPISAEEINGLPPFCLPDLCNVFEKRPLPHCHSFVMTDLLGIHKFAICLTYYRKFFALSNGEVGHFMLFSESVPHSKECYVPNCICYISNFPYFTLLKECLSYLSIASLLPDTSSQLRDLLLKTIPKLAFIPVPLPGTIPIAFSFYGQKHVVYPSLLNRPFCDVDLHHPFVLFSIDDILTIVTCILTEQRLVFMASDYALLTPIMECFFTYIQPFVWRPTYVPVLSSIMIDLLSAPGTFAMGCHSKFSDNVSEESEGLVVVNLDLGSVSVCPSLKVPEIPRFAAKIFKARFENIPKPFDLQYSRPTLSPNDERTARREHRDKLNSHIRAAFVELLAVLFQRVNEFCSFGRSPHFRKAAFLQSWKKHRPFYSMVCSSDMFGVFCQNRLRRKLDFFNEELEKLSKSSKSYDTTDSGPASLSSPLASLGSKKRASKKISGDFEVFATTEEILQTKDLCLESERHVSDEQILEADVDLTDGTQSYDEWFEKASSILDASLSMKTKAGCRYVKAIIFLARGEREKALEQFQAIAKECSPVYPEKLAQQIQGKEEGERPHIVSENIPRRDMSEYEFGRYAKAMNIVTDNEAVSRLWNCLTTQPNLTSQTLKTFVEIWKEITNLGCSIELPASLELDNVNEEVLLVSPLVRDSYGQGRLVLSQRRLLVLHGSVYSQISFLNEIAAMENITSPFLFSLGQEGLKVSFKDSSKAPYVVCLKESTNTWKEYITEMEAALSYADEHRDPSVVGSAGNNIIAAHALLQCQQDPNFLATLGLISPIESNLQPPSSLLIYQFKKSQLPDTTSSALDRRLYPAGEAERETIECLLYTKPKNEGESGKLWCGMGSSGALFVCDVDAWTFDFPINVAKNRIYFLEEYEGEIWVGSVDGNVYVLDSNSGRPLSTLPNHDESAISGITLATLNDQVTIWTSSFDGKLICWNPKTRDVLREIQIPKSRKVRSLISTGEWLWTSDKKKMLAIDVSDPKKHEIRNFAIDFPPEAPLTIDCLAKAPNEQIWCSWSGSDVCKLSLWCSKTQTCILVRNFKEFRGLTCMTICNKELWIGGREGQLLVIDWETTADKRILQEAHPAGVRSLCTMQGGLVASGSTSSDGYIAIWKKATQ
ncbi:DENN domain-containing protein 3-like isoform X2 [Oscarella lobularis]|uniref:DENN domain-containing protein 3-like isoform X2 n=1 Tax=Oscarella lobularis TaxID=121494 RepID=UPI003313E937